jgi:hypothetical protein
MNRLPTWAQFSIIAVLLSPMLAFLTVIAVEILFDVLMEVGVPAFLALVVAGVITGFVFRKLRVRPHESAPDWT